MNTNLLISCDSNGVVHGYIGQDSNINTMISNGTLDPTKFVDAAAQAGTFSLTPGQWMCVPAYSAHLHQGPNQSPEVV